jgi:chemotaxis protein methyltransferase CheR
MSGTSRAILADPDYRRLKLRILAATGLAYFTDKDEAFAERLQRRFAARGAGDCRAYLALLEAERFRGAEMDALAEHLTIGETFFYRYAQQFQALRDRLIPEVIARNAGSRRLRIWSAGCSTGAEAYSVAALVEQALGDRLASWQVSILGTDINQAFLAQARSAVFSDWAMRDVSPADRAATVEQVEGGWRVRPALRSMVEFRQHNLMDLESQHASADGLGDFDIILCRNVMIYFDRPTLEALVPRLAERLVDRGWLLVGHAEAGDLFQSSFETVLVPGTTLYRKRAAVPARLPSLTPAMVPRLPVSARRFGPSAAASSARRSPSRASAATPPRAAVAPAPAAGTEACYRAAAAAAPTDPVAHYLLALALDQEDAAAEAEQSLRRALYLDRGFVMAHFQLGAILRRRGDFEGALKAFGNALRSLTGFDEDMMIPAADLSVAELRPLLLNQMRSVRQP